MFTIQSNREITGTHWGLEFKVGVATTNDAALAEKLKGKGYTVTDGTEPVPEVTKEPEVTPVTAKKAKSRKAVKDRAVNG